MPTGKVKFYDKDKGFGFVTSDEGGDVFLPKAALPNGLTELKPGARIEFGVAASRRGDQALSVRLLEPAPMLPSARRSPEELHGLIEDMIKVLDVVQRDLRRGRHPARETARKIAKVVHAVADELEA